jgi:hypothetical protein
LIFGSRAASENNGMGKTGQDRYRDPNGLAILLVNREHFHGHFQAGRTAYTSVNN